MKLIAATNTHYGRGYPIVGQEALDRVRRAYSLIGIGGFDPPEEE